MEIIEFVYGILSYNGIPGFFSHIIIFSIAVFKTVSNVILLV